MTENTDRVIKLHEVDHICLFCGNEKKKHWDDYTPYYECDCEDVVFNNKIKEQIDGLKKQLRKPRFVVEKKPHLIALDK